MGDDLAEDLLGLGQCVGRNATDDRIRAVFEDRIGNIWVGTLDGLNLFDRRSGDFIRLGSAERGNEQMSFPTMPCPIRAARPT